MNNINEVERKIINAQKDLAESVAIKKLDKSDGIGINYASFLT